MTPEIIFFILSLIVLVVAGEWVIHSLVKISRYIGLKEFVVAFFTVSIGAVAPEFVIGISAALKGVPEMSLGNVVGENIFLLTVTVALATFFTWKGLTVQSRTAQAGITFTIAVSLLPLILIMDGELSRTDGLILVIVFFIFVSWLFSKKERFMKIYDSEEREKNPQTKRQVLIHVIIVLAGISLVFIAAHFLTTSAIAFSESWGLSLTFVGIFILAIATALPETYFAITLARRGESWMVLGGVMGGVAIASTLVLGTVALISPIVVEDTSTLVMARIFLAIAALVFIVTLSTSKKITKKEGTLLILIYLTFLLVEIIISDTPFYIP